MREAINLIANKYGYELQSRQCIEELSELIQAICKDKRKRTATSNNSEIIKPISKFSETGSHVIEEIADCEIMFEQLKLLMDCSDEVEKVKISKINRQLERIGVKLSQQEKDNNNGWIPVSERLPGECVPVNVTWINRNPESYYAKIKDVPFSATAVYYNSKWYWYSSTCVDYLSEYGNNDFDLVDKDIDIIAWMELPQPFQKGERE